MKLYNPFKWHIVERNNKFILRRFYIPHLGWSYHYRVDQVTSDINSAKTFVSLYAVRDYLDHIYSVKENEVKFVCTLDKLP